MIRYSSSWGSLGKSINRVGGGEGKAPVGGQPQTKWGKVAMGKKTRRRKNTDKFIVRKRR